MEEEEKDERDKVTPLEINYPENRISTDATEFSLDKMGLKITCSIVFASEKIVPCSGTSDFVCVNFITRNTTKRGISGCGTTTCRGSFKWL